MKKISGTVSCSDPSRTIEPDSVITVSVNDCSLACGPSINCGLKQINNVTSFPFSFEFEFNDGVIDERYIGEYNLSVQIKKDGKLTFITDTMFHLKDHSTQSIKDSIDKQNFQFFLIFPQAFCFGYRSKE
ncbi:hypothetical protein BpHYR1_014082 [Brachionus plicatilis]|uniref:Uncharacterized protein n=1 Tax=Brachionus plicatilis TaxID=10195 RepID=A0A3M7SGD6_BRAPC|nr:hypothetical protein BpHYR1_014082 [Brachionus plicatilis]